MIETETLITYALFAAILIVLFWAGWLEYRMRRFFKGKNGADLENTITTLLKSQKEMESFRCTLEEYLGSVEKRVKRSIQSVETLRFNPFKGDGSGGNQSFSIAFLDELGNGVVLSSLYRRDRVSTYSKPVKDFSSTFELTDEEKSVIEASKRKLSKEKAVS